MHKEYKRIAENSDTAILFIHGIVGTPNHFRAFVELVPEELTVYNLLLDGHGKGVRDFSHTSMKKWETQVCSAVDELARKHDKIYIAAHSLGCLLALEQAVLNPKVLKLFLLAVPLKLSIKPMMITNSLKVYSGRVSPDDPVATAARDCCGVTHSKNPFLYLGWIPRFLELFAKIRKTRKIVRRISTPCAAFQSAKDEMVSIRAMKVLRENPAICVVELKNSGHFYYESGDFAILKNAFMGFIS